jgi:hypothetical protein
MMGIVLVLAALAAATMWACLKASSDADDMDGRW